MINVKSYFSYFFVISLLKMSSNCCTVRPVNDLESSGFLAKLSYEIKENKLVDKLMVIKLFGSNHARDLINIRY